MRKEKKEEEEPETFYELNKVSFLHTWQEKKSTYFIYEIKLWGKVFLHFILHSFRFNSRTSKEAFKAQNKLFLVPSFPSSSVYSVDSKARCSEPEKNRALSGMRECF